ncbi:MAG: phospho-sugar mutase [Gemmataceae bacterium]|nr:phospho-sugar mutase [Gemmataceae bacterium]MDW8266928.1 phospho-sugar mutase [Gemmataceae bacterium]
MTAGPLPARRLAGEVMAMDLLARVAAGFDTIEADAALKEQALKYLGQWLTQPEFAPYWPQLHWLIEQGKWWGLLDRFCQILPFGTGGRRGPVGIGPNRMNRWTLGASVQGHCEYLKERFPGVEPLQVALAYDVRRFEDQRKNYNPALPNPVLHLSSRDLAQHAAGIYAANGIHAWILPPDSPRYLATPELSFVIRDLGAHGGLNISASHNPPDDNGGKFYDERGAQPVAPEDQIMAELVDQVTTIKALPWPEAVRTGRIHFLDEEPHRRYIDLCVRQSLVPPPRFDEFLVVFTPLHGVGSMTALEVLRRQGFRVRPVEEQMTPDGLFPNVTQSPNPEVPASMDRAEALAQREEADLVLATDPDADRIGAMVPDGSGRPWRFLTGNEIAALVVHFKLEQLKRQGRLPRSPIVLTTEVTTGLITRIGRHFGAQVVGNLLVGFKYMANVLWHLERDGRYEDIEGTPDDFVLGTEESHGILAMPQIRDKDAAAAALLLAELALEQKRRGRSVLDYLDGLWRQFGYFRNEMVPIVLTGIEGKQEMERMLDLLRRDPPREVGGLAVTSYEDLLDERGRLGPLQGATDRLARNFLIFRLGDQGKISLRPSGTEPKAKAYFETCSPPRPAGASDEVWRGMCREVDERMRQVATAFLEHVLGLVGRKLPEGGVRLSR